MVRLLVAARGTSKLTRLPYGEGVVKISVVVSADNDILIGFQLSSIDFASRKGFLMKTVKIDRE